MDLADLPSQESSPVLDIKSDDLISSDTGFVSDVTNDESPISEFSKDLEDDKDITNDESPISELSKDLEDDKDDVEQLPEEKAEEDQPENQETQQSEKEEFIDILGNGQLKRKVLVPGNGVVTRPNNGDTVTLRIQGKLEDGTQVEDGEISFVLNDGDVIVALDLGVALMEFSEKCELYTSSRYAYGDLGREPDIPKDAGITFTLELIDVKPQADPSSLTFQQRLQQGENKRVRGNYLFGRADYSGAINSYTKAVKVLDDTDLNAGLDESDRAQLEEVWTKCYNNMAACQLKIDATDAAIRSAEKVLSSQPNNIKALFRLGKAYGNKNEVDKAISYLKEAIQLDPESKMLHQELFTLTKRKNKETETEKDLYRKMLGVKPVSKPAASAVKEKKQSNSILRWGMAVGGLAAVAASVGVAWYRNS